MKRRILLTIFVFIFAYTICGQNKADKALGLNKNTLLSKVDFDDELRPDTLIMKVFSRAKTSAGVIWTFNESNFKKYKFNPEKFLVKDILESMTEVLPNYSWEEKNGVINLRSSSEYLILNTVISKFNLENATKDKMLASLEKTKEFKNAIKVSGVHKSPQISLGGLVSPKDNRNRFSIDCEYMTVKEILNEIVKQEGENSAWWYNEYSSNFLTEGQMKKRYYKLYYFISASNF